MGKHSLKEEQPVPVQSGTWTEEEMEEFANQEGTSK